ncbi:unnamed protein product [Effrenium voratum]|nr:unnamed protein product [Effrenium voratum]
MSFFKHRLRHVPEWEEELGAMFILLAPYHYNCVDEPYVSSGKDCRVAGLKREASVAAEVSLLKPARALADPSARLQVRLDHGLRVVVCMELTQTLGELEEAVERWCKDQGLAGLDGCHLRTAFPPRTYPDSEQTIEAAGLAPSATLFVAR